MAAAKYIQSRHRNKNMAILDEKRRAVEEEQRRLASLLKWTTTMSSTASQMPSGWWEEGKRPLSSSHTYVSRNWYPSPSLGLKEASQRFDSAHAKRTQAALTALELAARNFEAAPVAKTVYAVRRGRIQVGERRRAYGLGSEFWTERQMREKLGQPAVRKGLWNAKRATVLKKSIWSRRAQTCNSKSTLEVEETVHAMLDNDWKWALRHGLGDYIVAADDDGEEGEIEEAKQALKTNCWLVYSAFDYLASIGGTDVVSITLNAFTGFIKDAKLADDKSDNCKSSHLGQLFLLINAQRDRGENFVVPPSPTTLSPERSLSPTTTRSPSPPTVRLVEPQQQEPPKLGVGGAKLGGAFGGALGALTGGAAAASAPASVPAGNSVLAAFGARAAGGVAADGAAGGEEAVAADAGTNSILAAFAGGKGKLAGWGTVRAVHKVGVLAPTARAQVSARDKAAALAARQASGAESPKLSGSARTLSRHEWLQALVRLAIIRYVLPGERSVERCEDVSDAIHKLLFDDLVPRLDSALCQSSNEIRSQYCYTEAMDTTLQKYEQYLRSLFMAFAWDGIETEAAARLGLNEWVEFVKAFGIVDKDVTMREVTLAFAWSRMWVVNEHSKGSQRKLNGLSFEDFLEAFIRISLLKGWPNRRVITAAGYATCEIADYLEELRESDRRGYEAMLGEYAVPWDAIPYISAVDCVICLLRVVVWNVKVWRIRESAAFQAAGKPDAKIKVGDPLAGKPFSTTLVKNYKKWSQGPDAKRRR